MIPLALGLLSVAMPASAQLNVYYSGSERSNGKSTPLTSQFSLEKGRVAVLMKGSRSSRMLFLEKPGVLRVVDDGSRTYFDLDQKTREGMASGEGAMDEVQKQLAQLPPEQRKMAEQMMQGGMASSKPAATTYVWTKEKQTIGGYECTKVECMVGDEKRSEYWGTTSADFKMTPEERKTILAMQDYLRSFQIKVSMGGSDGGPSRAFQWDTNADGYPIVSRCFAHGDTTLDLRLARFDHQPLAKDLFEIPSGFKKQDPFAGAKTGKRGRTMAPPGR
jgi:hypothetical protein